MYGLTSAIFPHISFDKIFGQHDNFVYLVLGLLACYLFTSCSKKYTPKGLRLIDYWLLIFATIWGASGFFFLRLIIDPVSSFLRFPPFLYNALEIIYIPIPDWDSYLYLWTNQWFNFIRPRSFLFSSIMLPMAILLILLVLSLFFLKLYQRKALFMNSIRDFSLGLSVGISANLCGDLIYKMVFSRSTDVNIFLWGELHSILWIFSNIILGFFAPLCIIKLIEYFGDKNPYIERGLMERSI